MQFAEDLLTALKEAGWQATGVTQSLHTGNPVGLFVIVHDIASLPLALIACYRLWPPSVCNSPLRDRTILAFPMEPSALL